jgi:four helix bundle protein
MSNEEFGMRNEKQKGETGSTGEESKIPRSEFSVPHSNSLVPHSAISTPHSKDLQQRTFTFALRVMRFAESLPDNRSGRTIANQVIRCGTSVGANYRAAARARSTKDFIAKLGIVEEECDETIYWIDLAVATDCISQVKVAALRQEANELLAITVASIKTARQRTGRTSTSREHLECGMANAECRMSNEEKRQ